MGSFRRFYNCHFLVWFYTSKILRRWRLLCVVVIFVFFFVLTEYRNSHSNTYPYCIQAYKSHMEIYDIPAMSQTINHGLNTLQTTLTMNALGGSIVGVTLLQVLLFDVALPPPAPPTNKGACQPAPRKE